MTEQGICHQTSCTLPQQNGVAERKNMHLLEIARTMMFAMKVAKFYRGEVVLTATYLINRTPYKILSYKTPRETLSEQYPYTRMLS